MSIWLRMIIQVLIAREPEEAFKYLENAKQLIESKPVRRLTASVLLIVSLTLGST
jgi:hypothetical protein